MKRYTIKNIDKRFDEVAAKLKLLQRMNRTISFKPEREKGIIII
jgi:hypothetical protein